MEKGRTIIAAYRLPYTLVKEGEETTIKQNSGGLVSAMLSLATQNTGQDKIMWYGFDTTGNEQMVYESDAFSGHHVKITPELNELFYSGLCNATIWPLFHYYPYLTRYAEEEYDAYKQANQIMYEAIANDIQEGDFLWIHDYHLMLLPKLLRERFPHLKIGFFLHIPFPSYEIFRLLPNHWRKEILEGVMGSDLIGFHTNDYAQHFSKSVSRILGIQNEGQYLKYDDRNVQVNAFPISVDFKTFHDAYDQESSVRERENILKSLDGRKLIFSVDRLDYSKGLMYRLKGYEEFLKTNPQWHNKVEFIMLIIPSRDTIASYALMKKELEENIGRINGQYSTMNWAPIRYWYRSLSFDELIGLYTSADVGLITPIRDGMNLVAKEFIASRKDHKGVLVLSELTGSAAELGESLLINPTDAIAISDSILRALEMPEEEQEKRILSMQKRIQSYDVFRWAQEFKMAIEKTTTLNQKTEYRLLNQKVEEQLIKADAKSENSLLLIDYDGTLVPIAREPELAVPGGKVRELLYDLSKRHQVYVISGRDRTTLSRWLGDLPIGLVAEHGAFYKRQGEDWSHELKETLEWKNDVRDILQQYVIRCPGSFIEEKESSIAWHYRNAENDFAFVRSRELLDELRELMIKVRDINVLDGNKVIEVKNNNYSKGTAVKKILSEYKRPFVLCAGDDITDEDMFDSCPSSAYTVRIGIVNSRAKYLIKQREDLMTLLRKMSEKKVN